MRLEQMIGEMERRALKCNGLYRAAIRQQRLRQESRQGRDQQLERVIADFLDELNTHAGALEILYARRERAEQEQMTDNVFTLTDAMHSGASIDEVFFGGRPDDGEDEGDRCCLHAMLADAARNHEFHHLEAVA